ncbi:DUF3592 domain-containing protein [Pseudomonas asuensis]|uniref:DUF3592 domain-containing protein n=1 Tax=Pseudomonas asuensis TaxID=1825787 RepID=A0ABQ2GN19_9PSED|nr:DUF3592 domain-containing protein [Pseudomonas asuensis]GGM04412.1 hypothetical protein GCM10009425_14600 [Pseudomonas asuensis]
MVWLCAMGAILGMVLVMSLCQLWQWLKLANSNLAEGRIVHLKEDQTYLLTFSYQVQGQRYDLNFLDTLMGYSSSSLKALAEQVSVGDRIRVYYCTTDPSFCCVGFRPTHKNIVKVWLVNLLGPLAPFGF